MTHSGALAGIAAVAVIAAAVGLVASRRLTDRGPQYAGVIAVTPISRQVRTPREVCKSEEVKHVRPEPDARAPARKPARGGVREGDTYTTTEEHCTTVFAIETQRLGYEVRYRLNGAEGRLHMDHAPGARVLLREGKLVPEPSAAAPRGGGAT